MSTIKNYCIQDSFFQTKKSRRKKCDAVIEGHGSTCYTECHQIIIDVVVATKLLLRWVILKKRRIFLKNYRNK